MNSKEFTEKYYVERKNTDCWKWDKLNEQFGKEDVLPMWVADADFRCAESILAAFQKVVDHGVFGYNFPPEGYYDNFIRWEKEEHGCDVKREWIRFTPGIVPGLYSCVGAFTEPGDAVLINTPVYYPFSDSIRDMKRKRVCSELQNKDGYYIVDFEDFEEKIVKENVKLYILCSPHNPCGRVWKEEELKKLLDICVRHQVVVVSDEIHQDLIFGDNRHIPALAVSEGKYKENIILMTAASKSFNVAGLQNSYMVIPSEEKRKKLDAYTVYPSMTEGNYFGYVASEAAYGAGKDWLDGFKAVISENYEYLKTTVERELPGAVVTPLEGTYLAWVDLRKCVKKEDVKDIVLNKAKVAVDFGEWFSDESLGFIRINLATRIENVEKGVGAIIREVKNYHK